MSLSLILALALVAPLPDRVALTADQACTTPAAGSDVVVCGTRDSDRYRIEPEPSRSPTGRKAAIDLSERVRAAAETEKGEVGGRPSNRIMLRLKIKF
jgi:hypothetical protein